MNLEIKNLTGSEIEISGELSSEEFEKFWKKAVSDFSAKTELPGFRKGSAPEKILVDKIGETEILEEAARLALDEAWPKILVDKNIEALGRPEVIITKLAKRNPLGFKIKTVVLPEIDLKDYKAAASKIFERKEEEIAVEEKEIEQALEYLQKSRAKDGQSPMIDDEFAKNIGGFENLEQLKENLKENIRREKEIKRHEQKRMEALDSISSQSKIEIPPILIESEKQKMINELKESLRQIGITWEHYLDHIKKTEDDLKKEWSKEAERRVRYGLTLRKISDEEKIEVSEEELQNHVDKTLSQYPLEERKSLDPRRLKDYAYGIIRNEKVFKLLENGK